jgi:hypothetical protein
MLRAAAHRHLAVLLHAQRNVLYATLSRSERDTAAIDRAVFKLAHALGVELTARARPCPKCGTYRWEWTWCYGCTNVLREER